MYKILLLCTLTGCGTVGMQAANLVYNVPGYKDELQRDHENNINCLKVKQCVSYWDKEAGIFVVRMLDESELKALER